MPSMSASHLLRSLRNDQQVAPPPIPTAPTTKVSLLQLLFCCHCHCYLVIVDLVVFALSVCVLQVKVHLSFSHMICLLVKTLLTAFCVASPALTQAAFHLK